MTIRASKFDGKLLKLTCHQIWKKLDGLYLAGWPITFLQVLQRPESVYVNRSTTTICRLSSLNCSGDC